jgi:hypothetical protein
MNWTVSEAPGAEIPQVVIDHQLMVVGGVGVSHETFTLTNRLPDPFVE